MLRRSIRCGIKGMLYKLHRDPPEKFFELQKSYISERLFRVKYGEIYSELKLQLVFRRAVLIPAVMKPK